MKSVPWLDARRLIDAYDCILLDAYGVLVSSTGPIPGAARFVATLEEEDKPYFVLTNDAARLPETCGRFYRSHGIMVGDERVITAGSLLVERTASLRSRARLCACVIGPADSHAYAALAGLEVVDGSERELDVVAVCNTLPDLLGVAEQTLNRLYASIDAGAVPLLLAPNPDVIFPKGEGQFGITTGGLVGLLEAALDARYPEAQYRFERLGKPFAPIFEAAFRRSGTRNMVLVGDQVETDVRGARVFGIGAALVGTGVARIDDEACASVLPDYRLASLLLSE